MKPILFIDFDGTLCHDKFWRSLDSDRFEHIQRFLFAGNNAMVRDWMKGAYSSEAINQLLSKELQMPLEAVWNIFVEDCKTMTIPHDTLGRIGKLRENYRTILLTNNMDCFTRFTVPAQKLDSFFDLIVNSFDNKKLKEHNDGELFIQMADAGNTKIKDCILIDDSQAICSLFAKLGGQSCFVTHERPLDYWLISLLR